MDPLASMDNAAALSSSSPDDMLKVFIITLPKPGKEPTSLQNFRPLLLINHNLKLYAKVVMNRIIDILPTLIHPDQSGLTKVRQTADANRTSNQYYPPCLLSENTYSAYIFGCREGI